MGDDGEDDMAVFLIRARFFPTSSPRVIVAMYYVRSCKINQLTKIKVVTGRAS